MPRNVRNFWLDIEVDGRKAGVGTGPRNKEGGFHCKIKMRSEGSIYELPVTLTGRWRGGLLTLDIHSGSELVFSRTTKR